MTEITGTTTVLGKQLRNLFADKSAPSHDQQIFAGIINPGYQIASGTGDPSKNKFGGSSIGLQEPLFEASGFFINEHVPDYFRATINVDMPESVYIAYPPQKYLACIENVDWAPDVPERGPENFYFIKAVLEFEGHEHTVLIYYPDPFTKKERDLPGGGVNAPEHHPNRLEIIAPYIKGIAYGKEARVRVEEGTFIVMDMPVAKPAPKP